MSALERTTERERRELDQLVAMVESFARARRYGPQAGGFTEPVVVVEEPDGTLRATWCFPDGSQATFASAECPLYPDLTPVCGHEVFDGYGDWVGEDEPQPHLRFTTGAWMLLTTVTAQVLYWRYRSGDYGDGVPGAAKYSLACGDFELTDAAVVSSGRDPATSPGPLTVSLVGECHLMPRAET